MLRVGWKRNVSEMGNHLQIPLFNLNYKRRSDEQLMRSGNSPQDIDTYYRTALIESLLSVQNRL